MSAPRVAPAECPAPLISTRARSEGFFNIPLDELTAYRCSQTTFARCIWSAHGRRHRRRRGEGRPKRRRRLDRGLAILDKRRDGNGERAEAMTLIGDVAGRDCIIVDDEILTGGTVASSRELLRERGARSV